MLIQIRCFISALPFALMACMWGLTGGFMTEAVAEEFNSDESKVPPYVLPEVDRKSVV